MSCSRGPFSIVEDLTSIRLYFDSSALVKAFINEPGTAMVRGLLENSSPGTAHVSALQYVELRSSVVRRVARRELTQEEAQRSVQAIDELMGLLTIAPVSTPLLKEASEIIAGTGLRSLDAIQLATALNISRRSKTSLIFVAGDRRLLDAAVSSGLAALDPATA